MSRTIEIVGIFEGQKFRFDETMIGAIRLVNGSKSAAQEAGVDNPHGQITIKGEASVEDLEHRKAYRFLGHWADYRNRGTGRSEKQFHFRTFVAHVPHDASGLQNYLVSAGKGNGIGPAKAKKLVDAFGVDGVLEACRTKPDEVARVAALDQELADSFAEKLKSQQATENATLEVDRLLTGRGFPRTLGRRAIKEWGNRAAEIITSDPYQLMQFRGVGFRLTDKLYIELGKDPLAIDRQALCLWYGMASDNNGHTWFAARDAVSQMQRTIGSPNIDYRAAIIRGREYGQLSEEHYGAITSLRTNEVGLLDESGKSLWLAEGKHAAAERRLAEYVVQAINETESHDYMVFKTESFEETITLEYARCHRCDRPLTAPEVHVVDSKPYGPTCVGYLGASDVEVVPLKEWLVSFPEVRQWTEEVVDGWFKTPVFSLWPELDLVEGISDHQREQLDKALTKRIAILGGSPGTGKSYTVVQLIKAMVTSGRVGIHEIGIAAPTGKACVRLSELMQKAGIDARARTWHSLLGVGEQSEAGGWSFKHGPDCPLPFKVLIGDETSMVDLSLMKSIFAARMPGCHVLLVGDVNQLPPVGNGAPLRDLIASGYCGYGELREIKRNSGGIVEACAAIRDEKPWDHFLEASESNLIGLRVNSSRIPEELVLYLNGMQLGNMKYDRVWDCQVIVAVNERSELSRSKINQLLQNELNNSSKSEGTKFRVGDKVVCLKNGWYDSVCLIQDEDTQTNEEGEVYVANGELGKVDSIDGKLMIVKLWNPSRTIKVPLGKASTKENEGEESVSGCQWDLGYALSCHKCQGAEWPVVFVLLDEYPGAKMICDRAWIYTAISRAKDKCYLVGNLGLAQRFCRVQKINQRKTFLRELIGSMVFAGEDVEL